MITGAVSKRYARALAGYLQNRKMDIEEFAGELKAVAGLLNPGSEFHGLFMNKAVAAHHKAKILDRVIKEAEFSPLMANLLLLLIRKDRVLFLPDIYREFRLLADDLQDIIRGEVQTANDLPEEVIDYLKEKLGALMSKNVILTVKKNPGIIGGIIVRVGSLSFNGSLRAQLDGLKEKLIEGVTL